MPSGFAPQTPGDSVTDSLRMRQVGSTIAPTDVAQALEPYQLAPTRARGQSDQQLHSLAVQSVIAWWRRQHAPATPAGSPPAGSATGGGASGAGGSGGTGTSGAGTGGSASGGASLPDTAMGVGGGPSTSLPPILTPAQREQTSSASNPNVQRTEQRALQAAQQAAAQRAALLAQQRAIQEQQRQQAILRARQVAAQQAAEQRPLLLAAAGLANVTPPTYAMTSVTNLKAWIAQQVAARRRQTANRGMRSN